jgi:hypothetical protein
MSKYLRFVTVSVLVLLAMSSAVYAQYTGIPSVTMAFDPAMFTYTYTVVQPADAADTLGDFAVLGITDMADPYVMTNPTSGGIPVGTPPGWWQNRQTWTNPDTGQSGVEYRWYHGGVKKAPHASLPWTGLFIIQIPGSHPEPGIVTTMGASQIINTYSIDVPSTIVPEPSSAAALGAMLLGVSRMLVLRFRKR